MRWRRVGVAGVLAALASGVLLFGAAAGAAASSVNVPCAGGGSALAAAVAAANGSGGGTINLDKGCTYTLSVNNMDMGPNGLPVVISPITINGNGSTISGNHHVRVLDIDGADGGRLTLNNITITGGNSPGPGGGIFNNEGTTTLNHTLVTGNTSGAGGGGIVTGTIGSGPVGVMTLNNSEVSWNTVTGEQGGGGGGILNHAGTLTLNSSTVDHNTAPGGGGIATGTGSGNTEGGSLVTLNKSVISDNSVFGGQFAGGGGVANGGTLVSNSSQITGNTAPGGPGGGLLNHASATLNKTAVSGNTALDDTLGNTGIGGGIANFNFGIPGAPAPTLVLNNSTVTANAVSEDGIGGGLANPDFFGPGFVTLNHTDITGNTPDNCFPPGTITGCTG